MLGTTVPVRARLEKMPSENFPAHDHGGDDEPWEEDDEDDDDDENEVWDFSGHNHHPRLQLTLVLSVPLANGAWLNVRALLPRPAAGLAWPAIISTALMAVAVLGIVALTVRRLTRSLRAFAGAADRLGRGESIPPLAESGPIELRQATRAFNAMQERLARFVQDRTRMLAAISHDLRTPITTLRLRAEFVEDIAVREKIIETLDEMERISEATLAFTREDAASEETRTVDLAALLQSLADDVADLGYPVAFAGADRLPYACRTVAFKRVIRNLIDNAVRHGERARISLEDRPEGPRIVVDDDGPGIPDDRLAEVFEPFVRLEESRSPETGGVGLGLAVARSIVRSHGGELTLENRSGGGLRAIVSLPLEGARPQR